MEGDGGLSREMAEPRGRLSRLSEATLHVNESLDFDTVLQEVVNGARALTDPATGRAPPRTGRVVPRASSPRA